VRSLEQVEHAGFGKQSLAGRRYHLGNPAITGTNGGF
jgi:hypothetical protein